MSLSQDKQPNQWGVFQDSEAQRLLEGVVQALPEKANILLAGHEAAQPLAARFILAGHQVHSVDSATSVRDYTPRTSFDAIADIFSLYHLSRAETYTQIFKFSEWLQPGGQLVLATSVIDSQDKDHNRSHECVDECVRCYPVACMGDRVQATVFSKKGWASMAEKAGFSIETPGVDITLQSGSPERHHVLAMRKTEQQALMGPYPIPGSYRGPHLLSEAAWGPFASRLVRDEFDAVLDVLKGNQKVLDVGSGYGSKSFLRSYTLRQAHTEQPRQNYQKRLQLAPARPIPSSPTPIETQSRPRMPEQTVLRSRKARLRTSRSRTAPLTRWWPCGFCIMSSTSRSLCRRWLAWQIVLRRMLDW